MCTGYAQDQKEERSETCSHEPRAAEDSNESILIQLWSGRQELPGVMTTMMGNGKLAHGILALGH